MNAKLRLRDAVRPLLITAFALIISALPTFCQTRGFADSPTNQIQWRFADEETARDLLTERDDFVSRLSAFDRSARLKTSRPVGEEEYLNFVGKCCLAWTQEEQDAVRPVLETVARRVNELSLPLPAQITLIKTNGKEEGGAPYTRGSAVILPGKRLIGNAKQLERLMYHELFHIASRQNATLRDQLYQAIGFHFCGELEFPESLRTIKLTNPDAPIIRHCIQVEIDGNKVWALPILASNSETYDEEKGGEFFQYLRFELMVIQRDSESGALVQPAPESAPKLFSPRAANGFFEQIGNNTGYIIHPEEILADNFALLATRNEGIKSPEVIDKMRRVLEQRSE